MNNRRRSFVLAACDDGPMILSRMDHHINPDGMLTGVGAHMLETGSHSQHELDVLIQLSIHRRNRFGPGVMVVDCGAYVGDHAVGWAKAMEEWGSILAIEAQEWIFYALAGNLALNNLFNARAIWAAVSNSQGSMQMAVVDYQAEGHFSGLSLQPQFNGDIGQQVKYGTERVRTITIDGLGLPRLDILKMDIEGMEPQALEGASRTIARDRPVIWAEAMLCTPEAILARLPPGYRHVLLTANMLAMPEDDPSWGMIEIKDAA